MKRSPVLRSDRLDLFHLLAVTGCLSWQAA